MLWTEKYRPRRLDELIGNPQAREIIRSWAEAWEKGRPQKPLLLVGPPGVGKTASAYALANQFGWEIVEMNASDTRSRSIVERVLGAASESYTLFGKRRRLILIDEVDGLQGREDFGGVYAIIEIIKKAKQPVILTANDPYATPVVRVKPFCKVVEFKRVNYREIAAYLARILEKEGIPYEKEALLELAKKESGDVRSAILDLQAIAEREGKVTKELVAIIGQRDREANIFDVLRIIFKATKVMRPFRLTATLDIDPDLFKLWIVENIPREYEKPSEIAEAFHWASRADVFDGRIVRRQYWGFLAYSQELLVNGVIVAKEKPYRKFTPYRFPTWIKLLSQYKSKREMKKEIAKKLAKILHVSTRVVMQEYFPLLPIWFKDVKLAGGVVAKAGLKEEEVAFILGSEEGVDEIMKEAERQRRRALQEKRRERKEKKEEKEQSGRQVTLFDY